jgi:hypothetical protein
MALRCLAMRASIVVSGGVTALLAAAAAARAEPEAGLQHQAQADLGLAVIGLGYEVPVAARLALQLEGQIFGTYFLPWFDAGDNAKGLGAELRATWFARPSGRGLYVLAYGRLDAVRIDRDALTADGVGASAGGAVGWAFRLTRRVDLRVGIGAQYIYLRAETQGTRLGASTPFPTLDGVLGYRL